MAKVDLTNLKEFVDKSADELWWIMRYQGHDMTTAKATIRNLEELIELRGTKLEGC